MSTHQLRALVHAHQAIVASLCQGAHLLGNYKAYTVVLHADGYAILERGAYSNY